MAPSDSGNLDISLVEVECWQPLRSKHTTQNDHPSSQALPLKITCGDLERKPVLGIA
jgi:hypothetical protein